MSNKSVSHLGTDHFDILGGGGGGGGGGLVYLSKKSLSLDMQEKNNLAHEGVQKNNLA